MRLHLAVLNGHREFVCLIGSDEGHAMDMLESIKTELDANDLLLADYPEICHPIQALDGIANRCNGQLYQGERTHIGWTAKYIVLPSITPKGWAEGDSPFVRDDGRSKGSGAIIKVAGITGRIRGMKFKRPDGRSVRPNLVVLDDPQTDESARSVSQCQQRESILAGLSWGSRVRDKNLGDHALYGHSTGGHGRPDLEPRSASSVGWPAHADVYQFPTETKLWSGMPRSGQRDSGTRMAGLLRPSSNRTRQEAMDAGAVVAWPVRFNYDELSAIQHAMNLKLQDEAAFWAEYQNEPLPKCRRMRTN